MPDLRLSRRKLAKSAAALAALSVIPVAPASAAPAASRLFAFILGVDRYDGMSNLRRAVSDARSVSASISAMGYQTIEAINTDHEMTRRLFGEFKGQLANGGSAFIYLAGHGLQLGGQCFILPCNADCSNVERFNETSLSISEMMEDLGGLRPDQAVVVMDACRNPLSDIALPGRISGTSLVAAPSDFCVIYSAGEGQFALDSLSDADANPNGVFARHFLSFLDAARPIDDIFYDVSQAVRSDAAGVLHIQKPAVYNQSGRKLRLIPQRPQPAAQAPVAAVMENRLDRTGVLCIAHKNNSAFFVGRPDSPDRMQMFDLSTPHRDVLLLHDQCQAMGAQAVMLFEPDRSAILAECRRMARGAFDQIIVYFAGAGGLRGDDGIVLVRPVPEGAPLPGPEPEMDYLPIRELANALQPPGSGRKVMLLVDSCLSDWGFSVEEGQSESLLAALRADERENIAVLYSAAYGEGAMDQSPREPGRSPYAAALGRSLQKPGLTLAAFAASIRDDVHASTDAFQTPQLFANPGMRDHVVVQARPAAI